MGPMGRAVKRAADVAGALVAGPGALAAGLAIGLAVRLSAGPGVLFKQERAGKGGRPFVLYKFRTMRREADPFGPSPKGEKDPRLTPIGRWLRATSLDELPQLWNVLKGEMSLVGPRPLYVAQAQEWTERQRRRLEVKPGMTGLAQVRGRGSLTIEEKLELDVQYVERQGLGFDARILLATVGQVFRRGDIYEKRYSREQETRRRGG